jgi:hypothetical protein
MVCNGRDGSWEESLLCDVSVYCQSHLGGSAEMCLLLVGGGMAVTVAIRASVYSKVAVAAGIYGVL